MERVLGTRSVSVRFKSVLGLLMSGVSGYGVVGGFERITGRLMRELVYEDVSVQRGL